MNIEDLKEENASLKKDLDALRKKFEEAVGVVTQLLDVSKGGPEAALPKEVSDFLQTALESAKTELAASTQARLDLAWLLTRIGSWTNARADQHLRYEFGDERADAVIEWCARLGVRPDRWETKTMRRENAYHRVTDSKE